MIFSLAEESMIKFAVMVHPHSWVDNIISRLSAYIYTRREASRKCEFPFRMHLEAAEARRERRVNKFKETSILFSYLVPINIHVMQTRRRRVRASTQCILCSKESAGIGCTQKLSLSISSNNTLLLIATSRRADYESRTSTLKYLIMPA